MPSKDGMKKRKGGTGRYRTELVFVGAANAMSYAAFTVGARKGRGGRGMRRGV